jgi:hypothetical protein
MAIKAKWTFMVYMAGDNNLSDAGETDLAEMRKIGSTSEVNIIAQFDNAGNQGTRRFHVQRKGVKEKKWKLPETDSGDPKVLIKFVKWAVKEFPAERFALILWNHGGGWEPSELDKIARKAKTRSFSVREAAVRSASPLKKLLFRTSVAKIFTAGTAQERAILCDDGSGHSLDTLELGNVLLETKNTIGRPLDLLGMDACLMSNLEVAYQVRNFVRYIVASEESEPGDGWPYDLILRTLTTQPDIQPESLATEIVSDYIKSYENSSETVTQSAFDLSRMDEVVKPLDQLAASIIQALPQASNDLWQAQRKTARFYSNTLWDLAQFCGELGTATSEGSIRQAAAAARKSLEAARDRFIIAESHRGESVKNCGGLSIYIPAMATMSPYYADLAFAKEHQWFEMLTKWGGA